VINILTYILYSTVSYCRLLVKFAPSTGELSLTHSFGVNPSTQDHAIWLSKN